MSLVDSESSCCGNEVRHRSLQSNRRPASPRGNVQRRLPWTTVVGLLVDWRGLPAFLPLITWERMMRRSESDGLIPIWLMNGSVMPVMFVELLWSSLPTTLYRAGWKICRRFQNPLPLLVSSLLVHPFQISSSLEWHNYCTSYYVHTGTETNLGDWFVPSI